VARRGGGGGTASATAAVGNNVPCASRSAAAAFFARMDVWACGGDDGRGGDVVVVKRVGIQALKL
jgi:hypothetical protein